MKESRWFSEFVSVREGQEWMKRRHNSRLQPTVVWAEEDSKSLKPLIPLCLQSEEGSSDCMHCAQLVFSILDTLAPHAQEMSLPTIKMALLISMNIIKTILTDISRG